MKASLPKPDLDESQKRTLMLSVLGLGALAASGEGYRRRRRSDSSEWAKKGLVIVLVLAAIGALVALAARQRAKQASDVPVSDDGAGPGTDDLVETLAPVKPARATVSD